MCCVSITIHDENHEESDHSHPLLHVPFLVLHKNESRVIVVFDFNESLNDDFPVPQLLSPLDLLKMKKSGLLMDVICVLFLFVFTTQIEFCDCCV